MEDTEQADAEASQAMTEAAESTARLLMFLLERGEAPAKEDGEGRAEGPSLQ